MALKVEKKAQLVTFIRSLDIVYYEIIIDVISLLSWNPIIADSAKEFNHRYFLVHKAEYNVGVVVRESN